MLEKIRNYKPTGGIAALLGIASFCGSLGLLAFSWQLLMILIHGHPTISDTHVYVLSGIGGAWACTKLAVGLIRSQDGSFTAGFLAVLGISAGYVSLFRESPMSYLAPLLLVGGCIFLVVKLALVWEARKKSDEAVKPIEAN